ncbi:MAG: DUF6544 family protein [Devosia sp.]
MAVLKLIAMSITAVVILAVLVVGLAYWIFTQQIGADLDRLVAAAQPANATITEAMFASLPEPAQRYFRFAGVVGKPIPRLVRLTQKGRIRSSNAANWMTLESDETYSTNPPAFVWRAWFPAAATPVALGRDEYLEGRGSILMKMLAIAPLADQRGDELAAAGLMRFFNEAMWFPAALLGPNVSIAARDKDSFRAAISDRGLTAEAVFFVDADGRLTNFRAQRYNTDSRSIETWETPVGAYRDFGGLQLPSAGSAVWKLPSGDLNYIELEITGVTYEN